MRVPAISKLRYRARQFQSNNPREHYERGMLIHHQYDLRKPDELSWWDDVSFLLNDYRVQLSWIHPRMVYQDLIKAEAHRLTEHLNHFEILDCKPNKREKRGRSRKKTTDWFLDFPDDSAWQAAFAYEQNRLNREAQFEIYPYMNSHWTAHHRFVTLCIPMEINSVGELEQLVALCKRLLKRETSLATEFPNYCYNQDAWLRELDRIQQLPA